MGRERAAGGQLRERVPEWPRREGPGPEVEARRWERAIEPWESPYGAEAYPGALVLEDFRLTEDDPGGTLRVLLRYAVIRVLQLSEAGVLKGDALRTEKRLATEHLMLLPTKDWERRVLQRLTELCREEPPAGLIGAVNAAAECAAKRGHVMGAFAFHRAAWQLGVERAAWEEAARAARGIARLAILDEARYSTRLWERRAVVMERRARRAAEAAQAATAGS